MTNKDIQKRTEEVKEQIKHIKYLQHCEKDPEFAELYNGLIDDLELIIINLPVDEEEEPTLDINQHKADMARKEWLKQKEEDAELLDSKEYQEQAQQRLDDTNSANGNY